MDKPVKLRPKPVELEAMPYTGENADAIIKWVQETDPMMKSIREEHVLPAAHLGFSCGDGGKTISPVVRFLEIHSFSYVVRVGTGMWLVKNPSGIFTSLHDKYIKEKYDLIWPEPSPIF